MRKVLSIFLCLTMIVSIISVVGIGASAKENENLPLIFVTGIGQTFSYIGTQEGEKTFHYKYVDENGEFKEENIIFDQMCNLVNFDIKYVLKNLINEPVKTVKALTAIVQVLKSLFTGGYDVDYDNLCALADKLLCLNMVDENGKLPENIVTPFYTYPVKDYNDDARKRFERMIPCNEEISKYGEDRVFCFNYAPFGSIENLAEKLNDYINNIQEKYFPGQKVILVPMSMGAATVSHYLYKYGTQGDVAKVVSIVGCWDGSDVFADLLEGNYADNSPEVFYTQLISSLVTEDAYSSLINVVLHCFSKETLTPLMRNVVKALADEVILKAPTMLALIPSGRYDAIREKYLTRPGYEYALKEADEYHKTQSAIKTTMKNLNSTCGTEFYFIAGYDLAFGEVTPDYTFFKCFASSPTTNSDEIIQIGSTTVGTTSVTANTQFSKEYIAAAEKAGTDKYISPDKSIDLSTAAFPDHCFVFYKQKHELERNNIALQIALGIAKGDIEDVNTNPTVYPQFNKGRNLKTFEDSYLSKVNAIIENKDNKYSDALGENYASVKAEAEGLLDEGNAMMATTKIDPEADNATIEKFRVFCDKVDVLINGESEKEFVDYLRPVTTTLNKAIYFVTGPKGIPDLFK